MRLARATLRHQGWDRRHEAFLLGSLYCTAQADRGGLFWRAGAIAQDGKRHPNPLKAGRAGARPSGGVKSSSAPAGRHCDYRRKPPHSSKTCPSERPFRTCDGCASRVDGIAEALLAIPQQAAPLIEQLLGRIVESSTELPDLPEIARLSGRLVREMQDGGDGGIRTLGTGFTSTTV